MTEPSDLFIGKNVFPSIGSAYLDRTNQKTYALAEIIFNGSFTEAYLYYTRDHIQYGWPKEITSSSSPNPIYLFEETPGTSTDWFQINYPPDMYISPKSHSTVGDCLKRCCASVQKVTVTFDSEKTYENSLLKMTVVRACKFFSES
ncbi:MAG TPA: hypothetical protein DCE71_06380 [Parachlamydiales bacterium]|nr:hypothetical protein [Parachlamydiales bacterium]